MKTQAEEKVLEEEAEEKAEKEEKKAENEYALKHATAHGPFKTDREFMLKAPEFVPGPSVFPFVFNFSSFQDLCFRGGPPGLKMTGNSKAHQTGRTPRWYRFELRRNW